MTILVSNLHVHTYTHSTNSSQTPHTHTVTNPPFIDIIIIQFYCSLPLNWKGHCFHSASASLTYNVVFLYTRFNEQKSCTAFVSILYIQYTLNQSLRTHAFPYTLAIVVFVDCVHIHFVKQK